MERKFDWASRLNKKILELATTEFKYGSHDCCITTCDLILEMTGIDLAKDFRGYSGVKGVASLFRKRGRVEKIVEEVTSAFFIPSIPTHFAQRGDVVLVDSYRMGKGIGLIDLSGKRIIAVAQVGWEFLDTGEAIKAWRI